MKPIGISAEFVQPGKVGGTEFFVINLVRGFLEYLDGKEPVRVFGALAPFRDKEGVLETIPPVSTRGNRFIRELRSYARHGGSVRGVIYPNYFTPPWRKSGRIVTVIHDAQYRHYPENFSPQKKLWLSTAHRLTLARADVVVATSGFVKRDLVEIYGGCWERKITVVPIPISWDRFEQSAPAKKMALPPRYVLSVAAHYPHKNLATLIRAFKDVRAAHPDVSLVLAGQLPENLIGANRGADLRVLARELGLEDAIKITGYISDRQIFELYSQADLFVLPSIFEGFGMPPVEALGFGLPVVAANRTSLPEVTLGLGKLVSNPTDPSEMAEAIKEILKNPSSHRKTPEEVMRVRDTYRPSAIAKRYHELIDG